MTNAVRQKVIVQPGGRIEIVAPELVEGSEAEVIVLIEDDEEMQEDIQAYLAAKREIEASGEEFIPWEVVRARLLADEQEAPTQEDGEPQENRETALNTNFSSLGTPSVKPMDCRAT